MNSVVLIGRTTADIELSYTAQTQTAFGRFTLAVDRRKREDGADFIRCKVWGRTAENMSRYVKKGHKVGISGRIETGSYKNREGVTVYTTEVVVENFDFLEPKRSENTTHESAAEDFMSDITGDMSEIFEAVDDDLPF